VRKNRFRVQPTLAGLRSLCNRLAEMPEVGAVAGADVDDVAGVVGGTTTRAAIYRCPGARHAARLRGAITGKHKSDVIDDDVLARAGEVVILTGNQ
jgi:hypothetical protein